MHPIPYVFFKDQCRPAFERYGQTFGAPPEFMNFADMPDETRAQMPNMPTDAVMHGAVRIGEGWLYGSDDPSGETPAMNGVNIHVELDDEAETRRVWDALSEGADIRMPLEPTFWAPLFGTMTDRFGVRWMIAQKPDQPA
ncbi:hypothetical protein OG2516_14785 [Oceanicola granulosus HTCC2516]|uniref:PhnB-like domain-containing protein n=1 Tax=Oceanicola granulosus (strain ATCC BAA-861 / DSM 15982 / KCTC 12143 / HTCC2516) TaxID=314256 RepID=Q2CEV8_OCEGH|nr:VOC family protein [Oceanicola granulosus]EAR51150.1 hypothetical protein OG2516_14785 [Oceanicola granulosus HTCC2516]